MELSCAFAARGFYNTEIIESEDYIIEVPENWHKLSEEEQDVIMKEAWKDWLLDTMVRLEPYTYEELD